MGDAESRIGRSFDREGGRTFVAAFDGDPDTMTAVIEAARPGPDLGRLEGDPEKAVRDATGADARGVVFGRKIWRAESSAKTRVSLGEAVHGAAARRG